MDEFVDKFIRELRAEKDEYCDLDGYPRDEHICGIVEGLDIALDIVKRLVDRKIV